MWLRDAQGALSRWIRAPEGVANALAEEWAGTDPNRTGEARRRLEDLVRGDAALDATGRLEIYANAYFSRILTVLSKDYPALENALGSDRFNDLVTSYLLVEPSRHASLRYVGARLAGFLSNHDAAGEIRAQAPWAGDLAAFEWTRAEVFDAPDAPVLLRSDLASLAAEQFGDLQLRRGPWTRCDRYDHAVARLWRAGQEGEGIVPDDAIEETHMLVWRREERVLHRSLESAEAGALLLLGEGRSFAALCEWAAGRVDEAAAPALAAGWLEQWIADGILLGSGDG
jgi:hypothetical protein